jgi:energy-coupling factor transport system ATP-binding protein
MTYSLINLANVNVAKRDRSILQNISLDIFKNEIVLLIGISGSGKTTLLKLILNLLLPEHNWQISGNVVRFPGLRIAYVNQNPSLQVFKNYVYEEFTTSTKAEVQSLLDKANCAYLLEKRSLELSQGEKTIVALLRALSYKVNLIVLDEIFINLSENKKMLIKKLLCDFIDAGGSLVVADHDKFALNFPSRTFLLDQRELRSIDKEFASTWLNDEMKHVASDGQAAMKVNNDTDNVLEVTGVSSDLITNSVAQPISFIARPHEIIGIAGENGSGKSTLLEVIAGIKKAAGSIKWSNKKLNGLRGRKNIMNLIAEESAQQFYSRKVSTELDVVCAANSSIMARRILEAFDFENLKNCKIDELSYGEKQRLAIAFSMISDKQIWLFDEPTYGMDQKTRAAFILNVKFLASCGKIIIIAAHDVALLSHLTNRVINL